MFVYNNWYITTPTFLTLIRIFLTPFIVLAMIYHQWNYAFIMFIAAAGTDILDGFLARLMNDTTLLGAYLDPIADKVLLVSCFATLALVKFPVVEIPIWFVLLVLLKEIILIVGFCWILFKRKSLLVKPTLLGKVTTLLQILFIIWLFAGYFFDYFPLKAYDILLRLLLGVIFISLMHYAAREWVS